VPIRLYLTGRLTLEVDNKIVANERRFRGRQARTVFAYLVCQHGRPVSREELADVLWSTERPPAWEGAVSAIVSRLTALLGSSGLKARGAALLSGAGQYQLYLPDGAWIDLDAAAMAIDSAEGAIRAGNYQAAFGPATVAASICRRPFLSDAEGPWAELQRHKLRRQLLRALDCQAAIFLRNGEPHLAVDTAAEAVALDPFRETSSQLLMRAHVATGNRPEAVRVYHTLRSLLSEELGIDPSPDSEAVYLAVLG
jgi:DNA-binding SARP family transcriptional activator